MNRTERDLVQAFWSLLNEKPYNKITVQDIVDRCQVNRNTFYYHFQDIPAMAEQGIHQWVDNILEKNSIPDTPSECVEFLFYHCVEARPVLMNLYRSAQREAFQTGLFRIAGHLATRYIDYLGRGYQIPPDDREALIDLYRCTLAGAFLEWMESGMKENELKKARQVCSLVEGMEIRSLLKNAVFLPSGEEPLT